MRRTSTLVVIGLLLAGLTACSPRPADPHPTVEAPVIETPGPAVTSAPVALIPSFVVINAHSVSVGATTQELIREVPFTTAATTAVDLLSDAMEAEPVVSTIAGTGCSPEATVWDWTGLRLIAPAPRGADLGAQFIARATAAETGNGLGIDLTFADRVGATLADVVAHQAGGAYTVVSEDLGGGHAVAMLDGQDGDTWGVIMVVESGVVTSYYAPGYFHSDDPTC
jgi:hypothetical protein